MLDTGEVAVWTAVGTSDGLLNRKVQRAQIKVTDLAVWRGEDGGVRAWSNRCPHRGMRLSYGFVRGNRLTCLYHGWTYDGTGGCALIPAHMKLTPPKTITVAMYKAAEAGGLIWVASSTTEGEPNFSGSWRAIRSIHIGAQASAIESAIEASPLETGRLVRASSPRAYIHELEDGSRVICALQEINDHQTMMHVAVEGSESFDRNRRIDAWTRKIRRTAEKLIAVAKSDHSVLEGAKV